MNNCPVCQTTQTEPNGKYRARHRAFGGLTRTRCKDCGLVYADPTPSADRLQEFNESYYDSAHGVAADAQSIQRYHSAVNRVRLTHVLDYSSRRAPRPETVLEIGPGHGMFAQHFLTVHPTARYWAVETDLSCHPTLAGLGVRVLASVSEMPSDAPPIDLAIASHVLEHVADPRSFVSAMLATLRPGGVLFLEVPCRDHEHKALDEPHLLFFDKPAMLRLLTDLGADQVELSYHGIPLRHLSHPWHRFARRIGRLGTRVGLRAAAVGTARPPEFADPALAEEWEVVRPFRAHETSSEPAWWLRAMAVKV